MGTNRRPFQVAFRALLVAFVLSLAVILSNPQAVRLAILAKSQPPTPVLSDGAAVLAINIGRSPAEDGRHTRVAGQADNAPAAVEPTPDRKPTLVAQAPASSGPADDAQLPTPPEHPETVAPTDFDSATKDSAAKIARSARSARRISSVADGFSPRSTDTGTAAHGRTMPILSPAKLQGLEQRGEYFELPPPPGWEDNPVSLSESVAVGPSMTDDWAEPASPGAASIDWKQQDANDARAAQERLEAEIADLRQEIGHLTESQQIGSRLDQLQRGQQELLHLHQELPVDRMIQLLDLLMAELQSVRDTIPQPSSEIPLIGPSLEGEVSQAERGRISLRITDAELQDVLRMFSVLSGKSVILESEADRQKDHTQTPGADTSLERMSDTTPATSLFATSKPLMAPDFRETPASAAESSLPIPGNFRPMPLVPAQPPQHQMEQQRVRQTAWSSRCVACHSQRAAH